MCGDKCVYDGLFNPAGADASTESETYRKVGGSVKEAGLLSEDSESQMLISVALKFHYASVNEYIGFPKFSSQ